MPDLQPQWSTGFQRSGRRRWFTIRIRLEGPDHDWVRYRYIHEPMSVEQIVGTLERDIPPDRTVEYEIEEHVETIVWRGPVYRPGHQSQRAAVESRQLTIPDLVNVPE